MSGGGAPRTAPRTPAAGRARGDLVAGVVLLAFALWYGVMATLLSARNVPGDIGARAVPLFLAAVLGLLSLVMVGVSAGVLARSRKAAAAAAAGASGTAAEVGVRGLPWTSSPAWRTTLSLLLTVGYVLAMPAVGYLISTAVYVFVMTWVFRPASAVQAPAAGATAPPGPRRAGTVGPVEGRNGAQGRARMAWGRLWLLVAVAAATSVGLYLIFGRLLMVPVPGGHLAELLRLRR